MATILRVPFRRAGRAAARTRGRWLLTAAIALGVASGAATAADGPARPTRWEGAVGLVATWAPEYDGASASRLTLVPAGFVRYGRISISGAGGFTTRRSDDVDRGVAASLIERGPVRASLALRVDSGRSESDSARLAGMGDIDTTLRAQLTVRWRPWPRWSVSTGLSVDALGQGHGWWLQLGVHRDLPLSADTALGLGVTSRWSGQAYADRWFGVTPQQSAGSGYEVFRPTCGWSDVDLSARLRTELSADWSGFVGAHLSWQLGPSRQSPLTQRPFGWSIGSGLARRF